MAPRTNIKFRVRRATPKVKTGCATCKVRRVKCGEERPACNRCVKFGVKCDGYGDSQELPSSNSRVLRPSTPARRNSGISTSPSILLFESEQEYQYFDLFCSKTSFDILPTFDSEILRQALLQASNSSFSIRHAVVAIGALHKTSETAQAVRDYRMSIDNCTLNEHHETALRHYSKAIAHMREGTANGHTDLRTALLTCLVIICFEAWNGSQEMAIQQIMTAIRLLRGWRAQQSNDNRSILVLLSPNSATVEDYLYQLFRSLAAQTILCTTEIYPERQEIIENDKPDFINSTPETFSTLREATIYQKALIYRGIHFMSNVRSHDNSFDSATEQECLENCALKWLAAFDATSKGTSKVDHLEELFLRVKVLIIYILVETFGNAEPTRHDAHTAGFIQVVELAEEALSLQSCHSTFSLEAKLILALRTAGLKCRDRVVRRKALSLLLAHPRREGVYDSDFAAKTIEFAMEIEEEFIEDDYVPGWARVGCIQTEHDLLTRSATLVSSQRISERSEEIVTRQRIISWG